MQARATLFELLGTRAGWLAQRQAVLTGNVANADTPGFKPLDLEAWAPDRLPRGQGVGPGRVGLVRTLPGHTAAPPRDPGPFRAHEVEAYETAPSGNAVVLPEQLQKMASTELDYQLTTNLYRRYVGMLRTALGVPQG
jgi:flagellar basal-body rod protein FlgB